MDSTAPAWEAWSSWLPEAREQVLRVEDPAIVTYIGMNMRMLWTAEIQAQMIGLQGAVHPYDHEKLPLLSTMQFDSEGATSVYQSVKWPEDFHDDPFLVPAAIKNAWHQRAAKRPPTKVLKPSQYAKLLQPPAKTWIDFEMQLALLMEQLVLNAVLNVISGASSGSLASGKPALVAAPTVKAAVKQPTTEVQEDDSSDEEEPQYATSRAAKRARQRERRRQGKKEKKSGEDVARVVGGLPTASPLLSPALSAAPEPAMVETDSITPMPSPSLTAMSEPAVVHIPGVTSAKDGSGIVMQLTSLGAPAVLSEEKEKPDYGDAARREVESSVLNALKVQAESLSKQLEKETWGSVNDASAKDAAPEKPSGKKPSGKFPSQKEMQHTTAAPEFAGFGGVSSRGFGRGRPMGIGNQMQASPDAPIPHGRGRLLQPPPGLQAPKANAPSQPSGLSQPWIPGPAIPEDDDIEFSMLPMPYVDTYGSDHTDWAGVDWPTPAMNWAKTPSSPGTPGMALPRGHGGSYSENVSSAYMVSAMDEACSPHMGPQMQPGVPIAACSPHVGPQMESGIIPMYVTVPLALAHNCPHCGCQFATLPGAAAPDLPDEGSQPSPSPSEWSVAGA